MKNRSLARLGTALGLAAAVALGPIGTAGAQTLQGPDDRGTVGERGAPGLEDTEPTNTGPLPPSIGPMDQNPCPVAAPDPRVTNPGTVAAPDPRVANPGPVGAPDPRVTNPAPPAVQPTSETDKPCPVPPPPPTPGTTGDGTPETGPATGDATPTVEQGGPHAAAPTANLRTLANALAVLNKGVTLGVTAPAGLNVGDVEISILFGSQRVTADYDNAAGKRFEVHSPPLNGAIRRENVHITLTERTPGGKHYSILQTVDVEPRYDITLSELDVEVRFGCDIFSASDPRITWTDPDGVQHRFDGSGEFLRIREFAGTWTAVGVSRGLTAPTLEFSDRDPFGTVGENALPRGPQLLPRPDSEGYGTFVREVREVQQESYGDFCDAVLTYTLTYTPVVQPVV